MQFRDLKNLKDDDDDDDDDDNLKLTKRGQSRPLSLQQASRKVNRVLQFVIYRNARVLFSKTTGKKPANYASAGDRGEVNKIKDDRRYLTLHPPELSFKL